MGNGASASANLPADNNIVIVGAGYAGKELGLELIKHRMNFTIISLRDFWHHNNASVRAIVEPGIANKTMISLKTTFKEHFKLGKVTEIQASNKFVVLDSGEQVKYDILVIATGSLGPAPYKLDKENREEALQLYDTILKKVKSSSRIAVIGGGATGVEVAGEIATDYPDKNVTIIHAGQELVTPGLSNNFKKKLDGILNNLNIKVLLGEKVSNLDELGEEGPFILKTNKGTDVEVDLFLKSTGVRVNNAAYSSSLGDAMNEHGQLKINDYFEVVGYRDIYAIGDCCDAQEAKIALLAMEHGKLLASNLKRQIQNKKQRAYKEDNSPAAAAISVGRQRGILQLKNGLIPPEFVIVRVKSKEMQLPDFWKAMGQSMPK